MIDSDYTANNCAFKNTFNKYLVLMCYRTFSDFGWGEDLMVSE